MNIAIRKALESDLPALASLVEQLGYPSKGIEQRFALYSQDPSMGLFVAESEGKVLALLATHLLKPLHSSSPLLRIVSLVVDRHARRQGIGKLLLAWTEKKAQEQGCEAIELTSALHRQNNGSHAFYRSLDYRDSGACGKCYFRKEI